MNMTLITSLGEKSCAYLVSIILTMQNFAFLLIVPCCYSNHDSTTDTESYNHNKLSKLF